MRTAGRESEELGDSNQLAEPGLFVTAHAAMSYLLNPDRHLVSVNIYRDLKVSAISEWKRTVV